MNWQAIKNNLIGNLIWYVILFLLPSFYIAKINIYYLIFLIFPILISVIWSFKIWKIYNILGLKKVDKTIKNGITPEKALELCKNNFKFLGIAANKVVKSPNFEDTIKRCNNSACSIKFLLSHPNNKVFEFAAKRADKTVEEYKKMIENTLNKLKELVTEKEYNIEVRLYKTDKESGTPSFRLFFIDQKSVLISYYIYGEGDGLQMPQIELQKSKKGRDIENFYYAFDHYYNSIWEAAEPYIFD